LNWLWGPGAVLAVLGAVYTAFLFNQARARDLWQTPMISAIHLLVHAVMAGSVVMMVIIPESSKWSVNILLWGIGLNIVIMTKEIFMLHNTVDTKKTVQLMTKGYYSKYLWTGIIVGSIAPIIILTAYSNLSFVAGGLILIGIFLIEFVRIRVPQMIPLT